MRRRSTPPTRPVSRGARRHLSAFVLASAVLSLVAIDGSAWATPITNLVISEVMYDPSGNNDGRQWIEIFNGTGATVDLSDFELQWGRQSLTDSVLLSGLLAANTSFVIGGPTSNGSNASPTYDQIFNFNPNLGDGNHPWREDAIALFQVSTSTLMHIVVYGGNGNFVTFTDEQGATATAVDDSALGQGQSLENTGPGGWVVQSSPTPGTANPNLPATVPDPGTAMLLGAGLAGLALVSRTRRGRAQIVAS